MHDGGAGGILLVANYESDVGYAWWLMEHFWSEIAMAAARAGSTCLLVYPQLRTVPASISAAPIEVMEFRFACRSVPDVLRSVRLIRQRRIRSMYLTDWPYLHWSYGVWRLAGVKRSVIHDHTPGDRPPITGWPAAVKSALHALRVFSGTRYVAVSAYIGERMGLNGRVPQARRVVVTNGIRPFEQADVDRAGVRQHLGVPPDATLIVLVSRATYYKGLDFAVRCLARVFEKGHDRRAVFAVHCGDGPDKAAFERLAGDLGMAANFRFLGRRDNVREILHASDIAFHPSKGEAMSLAILEFMCAGLPVLTSDLPSVGAAIRPGLTGLTYEAGNLDSAAVRLGELIDAPVLRRTLGMAAADSCRREFSLDATDRQFARWVVPALLPPSSTGD